MTAIPDAPYFEDLAVGQVFDTAPALTLTPGIAAVHQSIVGDRLRLALDADLAWAVTGVRAAMAHPALVCNVAIGQSTLVTQRVKANLFYRGLVFHRFPVLGDTLRTRTEVVGLRANSVKPGRAPTGLAALRVITADQDDRVVLDFCRCAMLPLRPDARSDAADDLAAIGDDAAPPPRDPTGHWDAKAFRQWVGSSAAAQVRVGAVLHSSADVVSSAPELARLTLNIAATHHDRRVGGQRLVYGGHTIALASAQATRLLPDLVTVLAWQSCEHTAPVYEGDTLYSELHIEGVEPARRGAVLRLRSQVYAAGVGAGDDDRQVLDWRFSALQF